MNLIKTTIDRRTLLRILGTNALALGVARLASPLMGGVAFAEEAPPVESIAKIVGDPMKIPPPINRDHPIHHEVTLVAQEVMGEIEPGASFMYMTFNGQVPGPMIRVLEGDTITLKLKSLSDNAYLHNVDSHAVYGTGGGAAATVVKPGETKGFTFKAMYPGAFIYHCAVPEMDMHISSGMYGMLVVEPKQGLAKVDREFYLGYNEVYTVQRLGEKGLHKFDNDAMVREQPTYVLFNGAVNALTKARSNAMQAKVGETVRVFLVNGGPNLTCAFHPIGNVWSRAWAEGAVGNEARTNLQTLPVPPGSCFVGEMRLPVPETIKLVDHALTRVLNKGLMAEIEVSGAEAPNIFKPLQPVTPGMGH